MLSLDLAKIRTSHERFELEYAPAAVAADGDAFAVIAPVSLAFDIEKDKVRFHLAGRVRTILELPCSRCLEAFQWPVDVAFDLRYQPRSENTGEGEREIGEDDLSSAYYDNDTIDLGQLMQEQFYLALPMKPLCTDACLGLCSQCGANLNLGGCGCERRWDDPRFGALRALQNSSAKSE
jgi:uncharacterized protein